MLQTAKARAAGLQVRMAKPVHSRISPKKFGQDIYLNRPPVGMEYPFFVECLRANSTLSDLRLMAIPKKKRNPPAINLIS